MAEIPQEPQQLCFGWCRAFTKMTGVGLLDKFLTVWVSLECLLDKDLEDVANRDFCTVAVAEEDETDADLSI
jgi:hypothetical protein